MSHRQVKSQKQLSTEVDLLADQLERLTDEVVRLRRDHRADVDGLTLELASIRSFITSGEPRSLSSQFQELLRERFVSRSTRSEAGQLRAACFKKGMVMSLSKDRDSATRQIHKGGHPDPYTGSLTMPIFQTSTFVMRDAQHGADLFSHAAHGYIYTRLGNPNHVVVENNVADLENGEAAVATASGMAAIAAVLWTTLEAGDHIVAGRVLYGCTFFLCCTRPCPASGSRQRSSTPPTSRRCAPR